MTTDTAAIERLMRQQLDGTFTRITQEGRILTVEVPVDYTPKHFHAGNATRGKSLQASRRWSPEEDSIVLDARRNGMSLATIAEMVKRTEESTRKRIQVLRARMSLGRSGGRI